MNDISAILEKIDAQAQNYRRDALAGAEESAKSVKADYAAQAQRETAAAAAKSKAAAEAVMQRAVSQSGIARRNALLTARRDMMDRAFAIAQQKLVAMDDGSRAAFYAKIAAQNISTDAVLVLNAADQKTIGDAVLQQAKALIASLGKPFSLSPATDTGSFSGGLMLRQGRVEINCTYEVMLSAARESLEGDVVAALFGE